ncbi:MAG: Fe-S cluster assembly protein SufB [Gammaproteobacteria bacterium]|nr:MAG: Fe-S cluster assembly protein SufB [Pseudomonadota bacterium]MBC6945267.1 Fe-S cluster assembly protein SufB [Gammaproteobacteria bacterium]MCE7901088.1 Fe-S cluster assembly protein SufB [Gammaproteobacteria bacterium PRO9]MCQ3933358.1 Fe-S cluster assembly protein SufB [Gammaproteobacteria bacterium]MDL1880126.1 Fe-S cluster assembly protein SufB [Gammaproteobacteria bacterium PRO2]
MNKPGSIEELVGQKYRHGFVTDIESDTVPPGLDEDVIRLISAKKNEPAFLLEWRLKAFRYWLTQAEPSWAKLHHPPIDYQAISYYSAPKARKDGPRSIEEVDPKLLATYEKLGIPLHERARLAGVAVDAVFDSVSVTTTFQEKLAAAGVIFCSFSEAVRRHPAIVEEYLGSVVPYRDNYFATLNSAVFSDGSFVYVPKGVRCPMELSTYFRINAAKTGQFERTLIIAEEGSHVSYLEGCTAPQRDENQLHAAVVELVAMRGAEIKYSTVQNWYPGDEQGNGGIYNFVTKRGDCRGADSKISWTQVEAGSAITWKYPSCILRGDNSVGEFYSVAVTNNLQQADTGTKMIHIGRNTRSTIVSKGISAGRAQQSYRGLVKVFPSADGARNFTQCDSLLIGKLCGAHTFPYMEIRNPGAIIEHEATTSKISDDQLFYCRQRGLSAEDAVNLIVNGFCKQVFRELPMEFAVEAQNLLSVSLEGAVG